jgi:hypothetical protein
MPIRTNGIMRLSGMPPTPAGSPFGLGCDERGGGAGGDEHGAAVSLARDPDDRL